MESFNDILSPDMLTCCDQGDQIGYPVSEDCLALNIVRPAGYEGEWLPVGVWIHGGGLYMV